MIVKRGNAWQLRSKDGARLLGKHKSKADALQQERAIQIAKHMAGARGRSSRPTQPR